MKNDRYVKYVREHLETKARRWKKTQVTGVGSTKEFAYQNARETAQQNYGAFREKAKRFVKSGKKYQCILNIEYYVQE